MAGQFKLTKASIAGYAERMDSHKVTVAIATGVKPDEIVRLQPAFISRSGPSPGLGTGGASVILELDRLRSRNDDSRVLESLKALE